ncbi:MAG TPA: MarR family transcriptional regulator [Mycobacteriales bacterium]|nr:MarR family transcriptional regulator [Mycobacteriales bacterium]
MTVADAALASQLRMTVMRLARRLRAQRVDTGHTLSQLAALATVERHGPMSPGELAGHEKVQPPSMTKVVARLEEDGLLQRSAHPSDRRQHLLAVTRAGRDLLAADRRRRDAWLSRHLAGLDADELAALAQVLPLLQGLAES